MAFENRRKREANSRPDPKLPNYEIPCPRLNDFQGFDSITRYKTEDHPENDNKVFLNGIGNLDHPDIFFLSQCVYEEDIDDTTSEPRQLKSPIGTLFQRMCLMNGIQLEREYFTTVCKYAIPRKLKLKPSAKDIAYCAALLDEELTTAKPKIIVCIGKAAVTSILGLNIRLTKLEECWTYSEKYNAHVYIIGDIKDAYYKPEFYDKLSAELRILNDFRTSISTGIPLNKVLKHYRKIDKFVDLHNWLLQMEEEKNTLFAVDCEWRGQNFVDGNLRSIQFCWKPGEAVFIHLFDENNQYCFDRPYDEIKESLRRFFNKPDIRYYGHNFCADAVWMMNHLGLEAYGRCLLDTQYAFQTFNEYEELSLKKLASKYTDLGRYDFDLVMWSASKVKSKPKDKKDTAVDSVIVSLEDDDSAKKKIEGNDDEGYGSVPTEILFPYGCADVDATFRLAQIAFINLQKDGTLDYYLKIKHPFATDGFASMMEAGVPFNKEYANKARIAYLACACIMQLKFKEMLNDEAISLLNKALDDNNITDIITRNLIESLALDKTSSIEDNAKTLKKIIKDKSVVFNLIPYIQHLKFIDAFNPNSDKQKKEWLFTLKKYTPIKTTKTESGNPLDWEKVLLLPEREQKNYTPAVDKDTLKVFATKNHDLLCEHLLQMNAVGTILKTFLKGDEGGIQKFLCKDGKIHCSMALTESSRPRSFKPNILNLPRYVTDVIKGAFRKTYDYFGIRINDDKTLDYSQCDQEAFNTLVSELRTKFNIEEDLQIEDLLPVGLRSCFRAPDNCYYVDADLATAEVFSIAYLANDKKLIATLTDPDPQFGLILDEKGKEKPVRIAYIDEIVPMTDDAKDPSLLHDINDPKLLRDDKGELRHPKQDVHWAACENKWFLNTPREKLDKNSTRDAAGKASNFQIPYQASATLLERMIEVATGHPPAEGTGEKLILAYKMTKPDVDKWLEERKQEVLEKQCYISPTGFKRHYILPDEDIFMPTKLREKIISSLQRQNCNIGLQSLVADTLARAVYRINMFFIKNSLQSRVVVPLYDACYIVSPINEVELSKQILQKYLSDDNTWDLPGGRLKYNIDVEVTKGWGTKMTDKEEKEFKELMSSTKQIELKS